MWRKSFCLLSLILSIAFTGLSQKSELYFRHITKKDGLPSNRINSIYQDKDGFIWMGTYSGLCKYDGYTFKIFTSKAEDSTTLSHNDVYGMYEDTATGLLWICTEEGFCSYDKNKNSFKRYYFATATSAASVRARAIIDDNFGNLVFCTMGNGIYFYNKKTKEFTRYYMDLENPDPNSIGNNQVLSAITDDKDNLILGTGSGIDIFSRKNRRFYHTNIVNTTINVVYKTKSGDIYFGCAGDGSQNIHERAIYKLNGYRIAEDIIVDYVKLFTTTEPPLSIVEDSKGELWIALQNGGILMYNPSNEEITHYEVDKYNPNGLNSNSTLYIFKDRHNNIWLGTFNKGLSFYDNNRKQFFHYKVNFSPTGLFNNNVRAMLQDSDGDIWIGLKDGGGISLFHRKEGIFTNYPAADETNDLNQQYVFGLGEARPGEILIVGQDIGLTIFNKNTQEFTDLVPDPNDSTSITHNHNRYVYKDSWGRIWVCSVSRGLDLYNPNTQTFSHKYVTSDMLYLRRVFEDSRKNIWIGCRHQGLFQFDGASMTLLNTYTPVDGDNTSISSNHVQEIFEDSQKRLWVGTEFGLNFFDYATKTFISYLEKDGLPSNRIWGILEDSEENLWISTSNGLCKFTPPKNPMNRADKGEFKTYYERDGLQGDEFTENAYLKTRSGEMLFGGANGFNIFRPEEIKDNPFRPPVVITNFKLFNKPVNVGDKNSPLKVEISQTKEIILKHRQNTFSFEYVALNYSTPEQNEYQYMLVNFDNDWNKVGNQRIASYTNIDPGEYIFRVKGSNNDGLWNEEGASIQIIIKPPFWTRWWFYTLIIIAVLIIVYTFIKIRERTLQHDKEILEKKIKESETEIAQKHEEVEKQKEELRLRDIAEKEQRWYNEGLVKFGDILSKHKDDIEKYSTNVIMNIVDYIEAHQGGIFIENNDNPDDVFIELVGSYGYSKQKLEKKKFYQKEGLVGSCWAEKITMEITDVPDNYSYIGSGLGESQPKFLLLVPLKLDEIIIGVIEIMSFKQIPKYKITFVEKIAESVTSTITTTKANEKITKMLELSHTQHEQLSTQEEELRQNLEEMQATQEESKRAEGKLNQLIEKQQKEIRELRKKLASKEK